MQFLNKLYFFNPLKLTNKTELFIASSSINHLTWYKKEAVAGDPSSIQEGTTLHTSLGKSINHVIEGTPENVNQIAFDGLFFKTTSHYADGTTGAMKKFTAWINPDNIASIYSGCPDDCQLYFRSGAMLLICNKLPDVMAALIEHNKKQKDRKAMKYGKK